MDRLHKKPYMLTEIAFILECKDTYILIQTTSKVIGPYMLNTSTQFRRSGLVSQDCVFMIKYQHKSLVYHHIYFTNNRMLSVLVYAYTVSE